MNFLFAYSQCRSIFCWFILLLALSKPALSQSSSPRISGTPPIVAPSSSAPAGSPSSNKLDPRIEREKAALARAASQVVTQLQNEENDLYHRVVFFEKPTRLDPNSFASVQEVKDWKQLLGEMKAKVDLVAKLYNTAPQNLDAALTNEKVDPKIAIRFKSAILAGFPWEVIKRKNQLLQEYVEEHGKLLDFYEKNWGTWSKDSNSQKPKFSSPQLTATYSKLCNEIQATGKDLQAQYKSMTH